MEPRSFSSRFAHCNVHSWGRTLASAIDNCIRLKSEDLTNAQTKRVDAQLAFLRASMGAQDRVDGVSPPRSKKQRVHSPVTNTEKSATQMITIKSNNFSLALSPTSNIDVTLGALSVSPCMVERLCDFMRVVVPASPNPRNPRTFLKRKQCTFVLPGTSSYHFGQEHKTFRMASRFWPAPVRAALQYVRDHVVVDADAYNGVHVNLYEDASVGVAPHADKEASMLEGRSIYSFTLLQDPENPRPFSLYDAKGDKLFDILLDHESVLEMKGDMQKEFKHGIETMRPHHRFKPRINMTVRAFRAIHCPP